MQPSSKFTHSPWKKKKTRTTVISLPPIIINNATNNNNATSNILDLFVVVMAWWSTEQTSRQVRSGQGNLSRIQINLSQIDSSQCLRYTSYDIKHKYKYLPLLCCTPLHNTPPYWTPMRCVNCTVVCCAVLRFA